MKKDAIYYPYISFQNPKLIKGMSLFYDHIYRIVPDGINTVDSIELAPLIEEGKIGKFINPERYISETSQNFLENISSWEAAAVSGYDEEEGKLARLHVEKTDQAVRDLFQQSGYSTEGDWIDVPKELASIYMLYLANEIAERNKLNLATEDFDAWTATNYFRVNGKIDDYVVKYANKEKEESDKYALFSLVLNELVPINIGDIPAEKIVKFRNKRKDEINNFRQIIFDIYDLVQEVEEPKIKIDVLKNKIHELEKAKNDFKKSADIIGANNIWEGFKMVAFTTGATFGGILGNVPLFGQAAAMASVAFGGLFYVQNSKEELRELRAEKPISAIVSIEKDFKNYSSKRGGGDANHHALNCMEEFIND